MGSLVVEGLTKHFRRPSGRIQALRDVSFSAASGEVLGILGPNGAGKSSLLKVVSGLVLPDSGQVWWVDDSGRRTPVSVGVLTSEKSLYRRWTLMENLAYFGVLSGLSVQSAMQQATQLGQSLGLTGMLSVPVQQLSHGNTRRGELAATILGNPELVILDEPTLGLDVQISGVFEEWVRDMAKRHQRCVLLSTHEVEVAERLCDRVIVIDKGEVVFAGTVEAFRRVLPRLQAYLVEIDVSSSAEDAARSAAKAFSGWEVRALDDKHLYLATGLSASIGGIADTLVRAGVGVASVSRHPVSLRNLLRVFLGQRDEHTSPSPVSSTPMAVSSLRKALGLCEGLLVFARVLYFELAQSLRIMGRYPLNTASSLLMLLVVFYGLVFGANYLASGHLDASRLAEAVVGFALWMTVLDGCTLFAMGVANEAALGTLERLFVSRTPAWLVFVCRSVAASVPSVGSISLFSALLAIIAGARLDLSPVMVIPLLCALLSSYGIGLALGAVALTAKRIDKTVSLFQFAVLPLAFASPQNATIPWLRSLLRSLPITAANGLIRQLSEGLTPSHGDFLLLVVSSLLTLGLGIIAFEIGGRLARRRGSIGHI